MNAPATTSRVVRLETERLFLANFLSTDAPQLAALAGDRLVASTTRRIPHPYSLAMAESWIASLPPLQERDELDNFAIVSRADGSLLGSIGLYINRSDHQAELGYWIGRPYWNLGYATEAAQAVIDHAFTTQKLHRVFAYHMSRNPASGRVMQKIGMTQEGILREHRFKWGTFEDLVVYGMTVHDYLARAEQVRAS